ncbi:MAG: FAD-dependent monooxygenase, partial [Ignavibacteriaceae bacterium]
MSVPERYIYDVIIAGSGPAGASAAYILTKAGKRVLVLEKAGLPRYKTCGGGITSKGLNLIPFDMTKVLERSCYSVEINDFEAGISISTKRDKPVVSMTMRSDFDYHLIKEAEKYGADIKDETEVKELNHLEN